MEQLLPFTPHDGSFSLSGSLSFMGGRLEVRYSLRDPRNEVLGGPVTGEHAGAGVKRADNLWQATCFEAFWGEIGDAGYWELNLAPNGRAWNLYRFEGYRVPQPPRPSEDFALEEVAIAEGGFHAVLRASRTIGPIEASLAAVLRTKDGPQYYASRHAGAKADFHLRESFRRRG